MVGAYDGGEGGGELVFNLLEAPPVQDLDVSISLNGTARFNRDGVAALSGTVTCSGGDWLEIEGELRQQVGRFTVIGWAYTDAECTSEPTPFELSIAGTTGKFGGGQASATVWAIACGDDDCTFDSDSRTVRLRH